MGHETPAPDRHFGNPCHGSAYPNPAACETLSVSVGVDAATSGRCIGGGTSHRIEGALDGMPVACRRADEAGCVVCEDIYGRAVFDGCEGTGRQISVAGFAQLSSNSAILSESTTVEETIQRLVAPAQTPAATQGTTPTLPQTPTSPPRVASSDLCIDHAHRAFTDAFNAILTQNGLAFSFAPPRDLPQTAGLVHRGFCANPPQITRCDPAAQAEGRCYCSDRRAMKHPNGKFVRASGAMCRCSRMVAKAAWQACQSRPSDCPAGSGFQPDKYTAGVVTLWKMATQWLAAAQSAYPWGSSTTGSPSVEQVQQVQDLICLGSPPCAEPPGCRYFWRQRKRPSGSGRRDVSPAIAVAGSKSRRAIQPR